MLNSIGFSKFLQNLIFLAEQTSIQINFMPNLLWQKLFTKEPPKYFIIVNVLLNSDFSQFFLHSKFECQITLTIWGRVGGTGALEILALTLQLRVDTSSTGPFSRDGDVWLRFLSRCLVEILKMKFDQDLCLNLRVTQ